MEWKYNNRMERIAFGKNCNRMERIVSGKKLFFSDGSIISGWKSSFWKEVFYFEESLLVWKTSNIRVEVF